MKKDILDTFFKEIRNDLDIHDPSEDHFEKFAKQLSDSSNRVSKNKYSNTIWFKPLSIAATVVLLVISSLFLFQKNIGSDRELASVSEEMNTTQSFFTRTIEFKLKEIKKTATNTDMVLVNDAMTQLEKLEVDYQKLKQDLVISNNDARVISAMIENFQQRATLLEGVLETIHANKLNKKYSNENNIL